MCSQPEPWSTLIDMGEPSIRVATPFLFKLEHMDLPWHFLISPGYAHRPPTEGALPPTTPITQCGLIPLRTEAISILAVNRELLCTPPQCHSRFGVQKRWSTTGLTPP